MVTGTRCTGYRYRRFFQNCYEKELVSVRNIWYTDNEVIQMTGSTMIFVWLGLTVLFLILEGISVQLTSIWFALGALAALISALFHAPIWLQIVWFVAVSVLTLVLTRPLVRKYVNNRVTPTNADMVIGKDAVVTERIDNLHAKGAVLLDGKTWTARMDQESEGAEPGETVRVLRIEGVKLIVEKRD